MLGAQLQVSSQSIMSLRTSVSRDTPNTEPSGTISKDKNIKWPTRGIYRNPVYIKDEDELQDPKINFQFLPSFLFFLGDFLFWKGSEYRSKSAVISSNKSGGKRFSCGSPMLSISTVLSSSGHSYGKFILNDVFLVLFWFGTVDFIFGMWQTWQGDLG